MPPKPKSDDEIPTITEEQLEQMRRKMLRASRKPLLPTGTVTRCVTCKGDMVTTNDLRKVIPTPAGLLVITRLSGAECSSCGTKQFDAAALALILEHSGQEIVGDYETTVSRTSGRMIGTNFKGDLPRVLALKGHERLRWKILDRDHALVKVER